MTHAETRTRRHEPDTRAGVCSAGSSSVFLLEVPRCLSWAAADRHFQQWHVALNINTARQRAQRSRAEDIVCDKLAAAHLCDWCHLAHLFLPSICLMGAAATTVRCFSGVNPTQVKDDGETCHGFNLVTNVS